MRRIVHPIVLLAALAAASPGSTQEKPSPAIEEVAKLRGALANIKGTVVIMNGINQTEALKTLVDAILELDRRIERLERK